MLFKLNILLSDVLPEFRINKSLAWILSYSLICQQYVYGTICHHPQITAQWHMENGISAVLSVLLGIKVVITYQLPLLWKGSFGDIWKENWIRVGLNDLRAWLQCPRDNCLGLVTLNIFVGNFLTADLFTISWTELLIYIHLSYVCLCLFTWYTFQNVYFKRQMQTAPTLNTMACVTIIYFV